MTNKEFEKVFDATVAKCKGILISKNKEYARGGDKLSNFKKAAGCQGITPEQALKGMWIKHIVSVCDYIDDQASGINHRRGMKRFLIASTTFSCSKLL